ncbi:ABC transporter substrate-binding protein [Cryobacterium sp. AP23]
MSAEAAGSTGAVRLGLMRDSSSALTSDITLHELHGTKESPMNRTFRRGRRLGVVAAALTVVVLAGCSSSPAGGGTNAGGGDEKVTIRFAWWGSDTRHAITKEVIDLFEKEHPNITVEPEFSAFDSYFDKLATSAASGDLPDIVQMTDPFVYQYIDNSQLLDLNEVSEQLPTDDMSEASLAPVTVDDQIFGAPTGLSGFSIVVDPQAFTDAGVEIPDDTSWSWDDYIDIAKEIKAATGVTGAQIPMYIQPSTAWIRQQGEDWYAKDGTELGFKPDTLADYFEWVLKLRDSGATDSPEQAVENLSSGGAIEQSPIALHTGATQMLSVNQLGALEAASGRETELLLFPGEADADEVGAWATPAQYFTISAKSEHPAEAAELINFLLNTPESASILKFDRGVPASETVLTAITPELTPVETRIGDYITEVTDLDPSPLARPNPDAASAQTDIFDRVNQDVLFGRITPEEAGQRMFDELSAAL